MTVRSIQSTILEMGDVRVSGAKPALGSDAAARRIQRVWRRMVARIRMSQVIDAKRFSQAPVKSLESTPSPPLTADYVRRLAYFNRSAQGTQLYYDLTYAPPESQHGSSPLSTSSGNYGRDVKCDDDPVLERYSACLNEFIPPQESPLHVVPISNPFLFQALARNSFIVIRVKTLAELKEAITGVLVSISKEQKEKGGHVSQYLIEIVEKNADFPPDFQITRELTRSSRRLRLYENCVIARLEEVNHQPVLRSFYGCFVLVESWIRKAGLFPDRASLLTHWSELDGSDAILSKCAPGCSYELLKKVQVPHTTLHSLSELVEHPLFSAFEKSSFQLVGMRDDASFQKEMICNILRGMLAEPNFKKALKDTRKQVQLSHALNMILGQMSLTIEDSDIEEHYYRLRLIVAELQMIRQLSPVASEELDFTLSCALSLTLDKTHQLSVAFTPTGGMGAFGVALAAAAEQKGGKVNAATVGIPYFEVKDVLLPKTEISLTEAEVVVNGPKDEKLDFLAMDFHTPSHPGCSEYSMRSVDDFKRVLDKLKQSGKMADHFTLAVDITFNGYEDAHLKELQQIVQIHFPRINLVFWRSCTKMDFCGTDLGSGGVVIAVNGSTQYRSYNEILKLFTRGYSPSNPSFQTYLDMMKYASRPLNQRAQAYGIRAHQILNRVRKETGPTFKADTDLRRPYIEINLIPFVQHKEIEDDVKFLLTLARRLHVPIAFRDSFAFSIPSYCEPGNDMRFSCGLLDHKTNERLILLLKGYQEYLLHGKWEPTKEERAMIRAHLTRIKNRHQLLYHTYRPLGKTPSERQLHYRERALFHHKLLLEVMGCLSAW